jgi:hypothetical protein
MRVRIQKRRGRLAGSGRTTVRRTLQTGVAAMIVAATVAGGPALAGAVAFDAENADKVDGKHAVGAGASIDARRGKLVATDRTTGRLPADIIDSTAFATITAGDTADGGRFVDSRPVEVNRVTINAPRSGFLLINGSVHVNNDERNAEAYQLTARLNGAPVPGGAAQSFLGPDVVSGGIDPAEALNLSYTAMVPVEAGLNTITQDLGPAIAGTAESFALAFDNLTVTFVPAAQGSIG